MPLRAPVIAEIAENTWLIHFPGGGTAYALRGEERGLLIDDCRSPWPLPAVADRLFDGAPYERVFTDKTGEAPSSIELGGRCVRTIYGLGYFDEEKALAFTGGNLAAELRPPCPVSELLARLMRLRRLSPRRIYSSAPAFPKLLSMDPALLEDAVGACRAALHPSRAAYETEPGVLRYGKVTLFYDPARRYAEGEPETPYPLGL